MLYKECKCPPSRKRIQGQARKKKRHKKESDEE
jgi:hypothetical protein